MNIAVYCGSSPLANPAYIQAARDLGLWIGESGNSLVYGGSSIGLMGAVSAAVLEAGGDVFGVEPSFFIEAGVAQHNLTELIVVETMGERKEKMLELADVFVALPGGVGTLEEISEVMSRIRLRLEEGPCYFLNMDGFYDGLRDLLQNMIDAQFIEAPDCDFFLFPETVDALIALLEAHEVCPEGKPSRPVVPESNLQMG